MLSEWVYGVAPGITGSTRGHGRTVVGAGRRCELDCKERTDGASPDGAGRRCRGRFCSRQEWSTDRSENQGRFYIETGRV